MKNITRKFNAYLTLNNRKTRELAEYLNKTPAAFLNNIKRMTFRLDELVAILNLDNNCLIVLNKDRSIVKVYHKNNLPFNKRVYALMNELNLSDMHLAILNDQNIIIFELFLVDLEDDMNIKAG